MLSLEAAKGQIQGRVCDVMTENVHTAKASTSVTDACALMSKHKLRNLVIVDENNYVIGVVSQRDVVRQLVFPRGEGAETPPAAAGSQPVADLITRARPVTITPQAPLNKAAFVLTNNGVGCLPVLGPQRQLKGLLTISDLFRYVSKDTVVAAQPEFQYYRPIADNRRRQPAYVRRTSGDLVIPTAWIEDDELPTEYAMLGFNSLNGQVMVKFVDSGTESQGVLRVKRDKEQLTIAARGFVSQFNLGAQAMAFTVTTAPEHRALLLFPKQ